jgi:hypothetical protein
MKTNVNNFEQFTYWVPWLLRARILYFPVMVVTVHGKRWKLNGHLSNWRTPYNFKTYTDFSFHLNFYQANSCITFKFYEHI